MILTDRRIRPREQAKAPKISYERVKNNVHNHLDKKSFSYDGFSQTNQGKATKECEDRSFGRKSDGNQFF